MDENFRRNLEAEESGQKISLAVKLATYMKQNGASAAEISKETGLNPDKIIFFRCTKLQYISRT